jgi:hypothetical protein
MLRKQADPSDANADAQDLSQDGFAEPTAGWMLRSQF